MTIRKKLAGMVLLAACGLPLGAQAAPRYSINVLSGAGSAAFDINLGGQVVGQYLNGNGDQRAFIHSGMTALDLGTFGGATASAAAINNSGQVAGYASDGNGNERAFRYAGGVLQDLGTLGGDVARAYGIDGSGRVVGSASAPADSMDYLGMAFLYDNIAMTGLGYLPNGEDYPNSRALAINSAGLIVGASSATPFSAPEHPEHAFVYRNHALVDLGTLGGLYSVGRAINDSGVIVGRASTDLDPDGIGHTIPHAFLYIDGMMIDLGALGDDYVGSDALDVNNLGQVVGWTGIAGQNERHAFLYQGGSLHDLNQLIDPLSGWTVTDAAAINDLSQIAGTACRGGQCYAVRLDLVDLPEPGSLALMLTAMGMLGWTAARRRRMA